MKPSATTQLPRVAIVGRPNVGKSTLANRMCGSRVSIVEPTAGVTRDRVTVPARLDTDGGSRWIEVIDTGGIGIVDRDDLGPLVEQQIQAAMDTARLILWVVDVRDGITPLDLEVAKRLRGLPIPVLLVANKAEGTRFHWDVGEFHRLGIHDGPYAISAQNGEGLDPLYERILELLPDAVESDAAPVVAPVMKLAIVGQRNAGKSTLINAFAREERMIVSEVPGTTRDSVDVVFERGENTFIAIDTAGIRKKKSHEDAIDFYSDARSHKAIRRADVVILLFDVTNKLTGIDKQLARYVVDHYKPVILGANKWDLVVDRSPEDFRAYLDENLPGLQYAPVSFLSAKDGKGVDGTLKLAMELFTQSKTRVSTGDLNRVIVKALESRSPSSAGHAVRVKYATQAETSPPTFVLFVNDKKHFNKDYIRYLQNRLREELPFGEIPVRIVLRDKDSAEEEARS
ncbi:MAG: ribosome biogenesis GTPase Der [Planctomycetota bacterium]|nr:ribosome biogenesis GTPase Der [Planctomycetota bacterium]